MKGMGKCVERCGVVRGGVERCVGGVWDVGGRCGESGKVPVWGGGGDVWESVFGVWGEEWEMC